jgi:hypothetical protein
LAASDKEAEEDTGLSAHEVGAYGTGSGVRTRRRARTRRRRRRGRGTGRAHVTYHADAGSCWQGQSSKMSFKRTCATSASTMHLAVMGPSTRSIHSTPDSLSDLHANRMAIRFCIRFPVRQESTLILHGHEIVTKFNFLGSFKMKHVHNTRVTGNHGMQQKCACRDSIFVSNIESDRESDVSTDPKSGPLPFVSMGVHGSVHSVTHDTAQVLCCMCYKSIINS